MKLKGSRGNAVEGPGMIVVSKFLGNFYTCSFCARSSELLETSQGWKPSSLGRW